MRSVLTVGNFDGVHLGHQAIVRAAREMADELAAQVVACTFDPYPAEVLQGVAAGAFAANGESCRLFEGSRGESGGGGAF